MTRFVNPYTFVPHVPEPQRGRPAGHDAMGADRLSGVLKITLTARTPLLIGGFTGAAYEQVVVDGIGDGAGPVTFPRPA